MSTFKVVEARETFKGKNQEDYILFLSNNIWPQGLITRITLVQG
jgi:hypothetical protein